MNTQTLLSTMHNDAKVSLGEHEKLEIILFYNHTKGGVDTVDQMCRHYTCKSGTRRWPMAMFYNLVDIDVALKAFVIWKKLNPNGHMFLNVQRKMPYPPTFRGVLW